MLVQLPLHLDLLPGAPKASDLHDALAGHYSRTNTPEQWVSVLPPTDDLKLAADTLTDTNKLELRVFANEQYRQAVVIARLDNLGKGASGAAVQNLQLMLGL
jgi:N-acetyl-gamma-glutamyl-phosphate reductase